MAHAMKWCGESHCDGSVSVWITGDKETVTFNLSDHTGEHSIRTAKFRQLPPEQQQAIRAAVAEARTEARAKAESEANSKAAIHRLWSGELIRYGNEANGFIERTLAGTNYVTAKDCIYFPTFDKFSTSRGTGHAYDTRISCYYGTLIEGGIVIDKHDVLDEHPSYAMKSPMLDAHRSEVSRFRDAVSGHDSFMLDVLSAPECFGGVAMLAKAATVVDSVESFDYVPLGVYVEWWRKRGARVGRRVGNEIHWEDGQIDSIRHESDRWMSNGVIVKE